MSEYMQTIECHRNDADGMSVGDQKIKPEIHFSTLVDHLMLADFQPSGG